MPLYEYACSPCGEVTELIQKHGDPPPLCPTCKTRMAKKVSSSNFALKGGGWYKDGYSK